MKIHDILIVCLLILAFALTFFVIGVAHADDCAVEWKNSECNDGDLRNGYWWRGETWVPGLITMESHFMFTPQFTSGRITYYSPGVMEATARYMGFDLDGYLDGVALMGCAEIGATVWIRTLFTTYALDMMGEPWGDRGTEWEGPFLVVDCAEWDDHYAIAAGRWEVAEVGFRTAERWGLASRSWRGVKHLSYVRWGQVWIGDEKPAEWVRDPVVYPAMFYNEASFIPEWQPWLPYKPVFFNYPPRWYYGDAVGFRDLLGEWDLHYFPDLICADGLRMCLFSHIVR